METERPFLLSKSRRHLQLMPSVKELCEDPSHPDGSLSSGSEPISSSSLPMSADTEKTSKSSNNDQHASSQSLTGTPSLAKVPKHFSRTDSWNGSLGKIANAQKPNGKLRSASCSADASSPNFDPNLIVPGRQSGETVNLPAHLESETASHSLIVKDASKISSSSELPRNRRKGIVTQPMKVFGHFADDESAVPLDSSDVLEKQFVLLTSAHLTNKLTLHKRVELHTIHRNTLEQTFTNEVNTILERVKDLMPDCDVSTKEDLRDVQKKLQCLGDMIKKLAASSESYGAVQQEKIFADDAETLVSYVEHLKRLNTQAASIHELERNKLLQRMSTGSDDSTQPVSVNITRRCSTYGHANLVQPRQTATRRASVAMSSLAGLNIKQIADPRSKFQQAGKKISLGNLIRRQNSQGDCVLGAAAAKETFVELPAVSITGDKKEQDDNNNKDKEPNDGGRLRMIEPSSVARIHTIAPMMAQVETIELSSPTTTSSNIKIRRRRSIKRADTYQHPGCLTPQYEQSPTLEMRKWRMPKRVSKSLLEKLHGRLCNYQKYRDAHERCKQLVQPLDESLPNWRSNLFLIFILFIIFINLQNLLYSSQSLLCDER